MEMVVDPGVAQQELPDTRDTESPEWHWDLGGASYSISDMWDGYDIDEVVNPVLERMHSLRELQLAMR